LYQQIFNPGGQTGFFGIGEAIVASNSMEPKLCPNDLIFYKETDVNEISVGDTIVYKKTDANGNNMLIVHDVVQIGDGYVTTQGVNNAAPDEAFPISAIVGKYIFKIGKIGAILNLLSTQWAPVVIISTMLMIFAIRIIVYYVHKKRIVADISNNAKTRKALNHFFDI
jgi:signal peptidase I